MYYHRLQQYRESQTISRCRRDAPAVYTQRCREADCLLLPQSVPLLLYIHIIAYVYMHIKQQCIQRILALVLYEFLKEVSLGKVKDGRCLSCSLSYHM